MNNLHHSGEVKSPETLGYNSSTSCEEHFTEQALEQASEKSGHTLVEKISAGFTLVELMVVVAIIALLAATAIPQYRKYQAKSRTTEAKLALASIYTAEESFYAEYNNYSTCLSFMGYLPSGSSSDRYYNVGFSSVSTYSSSAPAGCQAAPGSTYYYTGTKVPGGSVTALTNTALITSYIVAGWLGFSAEAVGIIDRGYTTTSTADRWYIDNNKTLSQTVVGY